MSETVEKLRWTELAVRQVRERLEKEGYYPGLTNDIAWALHKFDDLLAIKRLLAGGMTG